VSPARRSPIVAGGSLALIAASAFGLSTPLIQRAGHDVGPFSTAGLLYAGAAMFAALPAGAGARTGTEAPVTRHHVRRLALVAALGAVVAPVTLAWGLQRTSASSASLLLNFEAVFTVLLARVFHAEPIGRRVAVAVTLMALAGALLVMRTRDDLMAADIGAGAVLAASLAWAADNTLTRPLADLDPGAVVRWKSLLGAAMSISGAVLLREAPPSLASACALLACGAVGYGASLRLYLRAQRIMGAARTGSIFAVAPFIGAGAAWALGDRDLGASSVAAAALFAVAIALHLTEKHRHHHHHEALEHEHAHRHDDGHHHHRHDPLPAGEHSHAHRHEAQVHSHEHAPDLHHRHEHR
jgi:drug/metabolite transporter (DMT)-like permease